VFSEAIAELAACSRLQPWAARKRRASFSGCSWCRAWDTIDVLPALESWVERGIAPDKMIASRVTNRATERTRRFVVTDDDQQGHSLPDISFGKGYIAKSPIL